MRNLSELNINEGGRPVERTPPSQSSLQEFQEEFGVLLPKDYVEFLTAANGGHPELDSFVPTGNDASNRFAIDYFYHLTDGDRKSTSGAWWTMSKWQAELGTGCVPIGRDGGGNQICIDCNNGGSVFLCLHDEGLKKVAVAVSFSAFVDLLGEDPDMI